MKTVILALFVLLGSPLFPFSAMAETAETPILPVLGVGTDDARPLRQALSDRTVRNIDALHLQISSGRVVELVGIDIPQQGGYADSDDILAAKEFLDRLFADNKSREVSLYQTPGSGNGRTNRLGHDLAHVVRKDGNVWIQGALIANGLAQARPTPSNPELADKMYALEDAARTAKRGVWADGHPHRLVQAADTITPLDRFAVVEGVVQKVSTVNNVTYLNFGDDWRKDFTVGIPSPVRQALARQGVDVFKLQGQRLQARGWIRFYNGPYIELEHPVLLQQVNNEQPVPTP